MAFNILVNSQAFYDRLATASAGSTARAALGTVSQAKSLKDAAALPRVLALYRAGPIPGNSRDGNRAQFRWWLYDEDVYSWVRINTAAPLIIELFGENVFPHFHLHFDGIGDEAPDPGLHIPCRSLTWTAFNRQ